MSPYNNVRDIMLARVPSLRAFAVSLCGNVDRADDLVREALLRALANLGSFEPGTNMSASLFTILRKIGFGDSAGDVSAPRSPYGAIA